VSTSDPLPYAEDAVGLTWRIWALTIIPVLVQVLITVFAPIPVWGTTLGGALTAEVFAFTYVHQCRIAGIRITEAEVRIGGCRRGEKLRRQGKQPPTVINPQFRLRSEFVVPVDAVRSARVVGRDGFSSLPHGVDTPRRRGRSRRRIGLAQLLSPLANAALSLDVDLSRAQAPGLSPYVFEQLTVRRTSGSYALTDQWTVATRRPAELKEALAAAGIPVDPGLPAPAG
jgi:hypothetical protein